MQLLKLIIMATTFLASATSAMAQKQTKKVLLVIDVQENLLKPHSKLHVDPKTVSSFIENLNKSIKFFKENNMPVIYTINEWTNPILNLLSGNVCKKGNKGIDIDKSVDLVSDQVYKKSKMSALSNKELSRFLKQNDISEVYITGLFAEACVKGTTKAAIHNNYNVVIIEDAVGSRNSKKKLRSISYCQRKGAKIISSNQLFSAIKQ